MPPAATSRRPHMRWHKGQIGSVQMQNFMCHPDFSITFKPNLNIVVGANGVGKSSIVEALRLALGDVTKGTNLSDKASAATVSRIKKGCVDACVEVAVAVDEQGTTRKFRRTLSVRGDTVSSKYWCSVPGNGIQPTNAVEYKKQLAELGAVSGDSMMQILSQHDVSKFIDSTPMVKLQNLEEVIHIPALNDGSLERADDGRSSPTVAERSKSPAKSQRPNADKDAPTTDKHAAATSPATELLIDVRANAAVACNQFVEASNTIVANNNKRGKMMQDVRDLEQQLNLLQSASDRNHMEMLEKHIALKKYERARDRHTEVLTDQIDYRSKIENIALNAAQRETIGKEKQCQTAAIKQHCSSLGRNRLRTRQEFEKSEFDLRNMPPVVTARFDSLNESKSSIDAVRRAITELNQEIASINTPFDETAERQKYGQLQKDLSDKQREFEELGGHTVAVQRRQQLELRASDMHRREQEEKSKTFEAKIGQQRVINPPAAQLIAQFKAHVELMQQQGKLKDRCVGPLFANLFAVPGAPPAGGPVNAALYQQGPSEQVMRACEALIPQKDLRMFVFENLDDLKAAQDSFGNGRRVNVMGASQQRYVLVPDEIKADFRRLSAQNYGGAHPPNVVWMEDFITTENDFVKNTVFFISRLHQVPVIRVKSPPTPQLFDAIKVLMLKHLSRGITRYVISNATKAARDTGEDLKLYTVKQSEYNRQCVSDSQSAIGPTNLLRHFWDSPASEREHRLKFFNEAREIEHDKAVLGQYATKVKELSDVLDKMRKDLKDVERRLQGRDINRRRLSTLRAELDEKNAQLQEKLAGQAELDAPHLRSLHEALMAHAAVVGVACNKMVDQVQTSVFGVAPRPPPVDEAGKTKQKTENIVRIDDDDDDIIDSDSEDSSLRDAPDADAQVTAVEPSSARAIVLGVFRHAQRHLMQNIELKKTPLQSEEELKKELEKLDKQLSIHKKEAKSAITKLYSLLIPSKTHRSQEDSSLDPVAAEADRSQLSSVSQQPNDDVDGEAAAADAPASPTSSQRSASAGRRLRAAEIDEKQLDATEVDEMLGLLPPDKYTEFTIRYRDYPKELPDLCEAVQELERLRKTQKEAKRIEEVTKKLEDARAKEKKFGAIVQRAAEDRDSWEKIFRRDLRRWRHGIEEHVANLSAEFDKLLKTADRKFKGRVQLKLEKRHDGPKPKVTSAERGGVNDDDFDVRTAGLDVLVAFKPKAGLRSIHECPFSGGERSLTTMFLIMALQLLGDAGAPYRIVDEINQGMDPINETAVMRSLINRAGDQATTTQYIVITPNLLENVLAELDDSDKTTIVHTLVPFFMVERPFRSSAAATNNAEPPEEDGGARQRLSRRGKKRSLPDDSGTASQQHPVKSKLRRVTQEDAEKRYFSNFDKYADVVGRMWNSLKFEGMEEHWRSGGSFEAV